MAQSIDLESSSSQYAYAADSTSLSITGDISIEAWVKLESLSTDTGVVVKMDSGSTRSYEMLIRPIDASNYTFEFAWSVDGNAVAEAKLTVTSAPPIATWTHYAITWEAAAGQTIFYINAVNSGSNTAGASSINDSTSTLRIGFQQPDYNSYFDGKIDEVRIWNDLRTATEISNNYQIQLTGSEANLQAYYQFDNYNDLTSNGNTLTASGTPTFSTDVPFTQATTSTSTTTSTTTTSTSKTTSTSRTTSTSKSTSTTTTSTSTTTTSTSKSTSTSTTLTVTSTSTTTSTSTSKTTSTSTTTTSTSTTSTSTSTTSTSISTTSTSTTLDLKFSIEKL